MVHTAYGSAFSFPIFFLQISTFGPKGVAKNLLEALVIFPTDSQYNIVYPFQLKKKFLQKLYLLINRPK